MTSEFGASYAAAYDALYQDKDYSGECDHVQSILDRYSTGPVSSILDLGCGTGGHAIVLAGRGYRVVGVDRSEDMLAEFRSKAKGGRLRPVHGDIRTVELGERFDAALLMFAVLGYQLENEDLRATLANVRRHLEPGGLCVFDVWFGPAVIHLRPGEKTKIIPSSGGELVRQASGTLDLLKQICTVEYRVSQARAGEEPLEYEERHRMRYFFPRELELLLDDAGFDLVRIGAFSDIDRDPDETTWNALVVGRAR